MNNLVINQPKKPTIVIDASYYTDDDLDATKHFALNPKRFKKELLQKN